MKRRRDWCPGGGLVLDFTYNQENRDTPPERRKIKTVRCSECGQRFEVHNKECSDHGCIHSFVPKHKATVRDAKMPSLKRIRKAIDARGRRRV